MILVVPVSSAPGSCLTQTVTLDGRDYVLRLLWSERAGASGHWLLRISDDAGTTIKGDTKVCHGVSFTLRLTSSARPEGELWCVTVSESDPRLLDLGAGAYLLYVEEVSCA